MSFHLLTSLKIGALSLMALLLLPACSVNVQKDKNGEEKKVDIRTPVGNIKVDTSADARDTGLAVYPGARIREKGDDGDHKQANVNLSFGDYGLKVVAVEYESDDASEKLIAFYQGQLKKYGSVLECHVHSHGGHVEIKDKHDSNSKALSCEDDGGSTVELKVGTEENQRIVAIEPKDKGCNFALVRVQTHGKDTI
jgi:hypothetical protein